MAPQDGRHSICRDLIDVHSSQSQSLTDRITQRKRLIGRSVGYHDGHCDCQELGSEAVTLKSAASEQDPGLLGHGTAHRADRTSSSILIRVQTVFIFSSFWTRGLFDPAGRASCLNNRETLDSVRGLQTAENVDAVLVPVRLSTLHFIILSTLEDLELTKVFGSHPARSSIHKDLQKITALQSQTFRRWITLRLMLPEIYVICVQDEELRVAEEV
ncbi:hypothetical protein GBF38_001210 [Nibea albiflora]|uniref:Uncharacterized protein n=1 Tax=Nibea albiflora TaxID=240163 RepID=A0ACB7EU34_NIBAL|nr:hypothetical protein GBF38_001210 [Nibea albiflora]